MVEIDPKLKQAKAAVEKSLLNRPGVTGVDIGYKEIGGRPTSTLAIRVLVEKKRDVSSAEAIPQAIEGFPTDVIERKFVLHPLAMRALDLVLEADTKAYPVLTGGISVGPCRLVDRMTWGGTLGAVVTDNATGKPMILSNFHVLCIDKTWADGDAIAQPSRIDGAACPQSQVAVLKRGVFGEQVDCAVAEILNHEADREIMEIGKISGTNTAVIGETVRKRGRTTGLTYGIVDTNELSVNLDFGHGIGQIQLANQIGIKPDPARNAKFGDNGDSGSVIVNDANEVVALYFAGDPQDPYGLANPIAAVLAALDVTFSVQPTQPNQPSQPTQPTQPTQPNQPSQPTQPTQPTQPNQPSQPTQPTQPTQPNQPSQPTQPTQPTQPSQPSQPNQPGQGPTQPAQPGRPCQPFEEPELIPYPSTPQFPPPPPFLIPYPPPPPLPPGPGIC